MYLDCLKMLDVRSIYLQNWVVWWVKSKQIHQTLSIWALNQAMACLTEMLDQVAVTLNFCSSTPAKGCNPKDNGNLRA